jgi:hypothetical protein
MERAPDYVEWLVNDILNANELFLLAAGKSLLAMRLSRAVACGTKFLDRPVMQGPVIYVNLEDADAKIKERVEAQQWPEGVPVHWLDADLQAPILQTIQDSTARHVFPRSFHRTQ